MKFKQYLYITAPDSFAAGHYGGCFTLSGNEDMTDSEYCSDWINVGEIEFEVDIDNKTLVDKQVKNIEMAEQEERARHQVKMDILANKKKNLLSIEHKETT